MIRSVQKSPDIINIRTGCTTLVSPGSQREWTGMLCVNNDDFIVLGSGDGRCRGVSMCTVWPSNSK